MPTSSSAFSLEKKKALKINHKSLTPSSEKHSKNESKTSKSGTLQRSQSTLSVCSKNQNVQPLLLQTYPDGTIHIKRKEEEKEKNADRLCLDRRALTIIPILDNESKLRLLSLQHNLLTSLEGLAMQKFPLLVFLDIYDNQLEQVQYLDNLINLRVLLLGKNRIKKIDGLDGLQKLEVLDLHGNQIGCITGLEQCVSLKVLNLAGNQIKAVGEEDFINLRHLEELNLRRNKVKKLLGFSATNRLQKLFLSNNDIQSVEDMLNIAKSSNVKELSIDNNPVFQTGECISFLVSYLPKLSNLNGMSVTDQARKAAMAWRRNKELSNDEFKNLSQVVNINGRREEIISNARTNWELLRSQTKCIPSSSTLEKAANLKPDTDIITTKLVKRDFKNPLRHKTRMDVLPNKQRFFSRNNSLDTDSSSNQTDHFRLPPILVPIINKLDTFSTSSIGPNIDSSASSILSSSSDSESESSLEEEAPRAESVQMMEATEQLTVVNIPPINVEASSSGNNTETSSNLSTNTISSNKSDLSTTKSTLSSKGRRVVKSASSGSKQRASGKVRATTAKPLSKKVMLCDTANVPLYPSSAAPREREQGGDYLIEICGRHLNIYGQGALRFIDRSWCPSKANDVQTINFNYANFNNIYPMLSKIKGRFANAEHYVFKETNMYCLGQLNALAEVQKMTSLAISDDGNPICAKEWKPYAIYRLSHWGLKIVNEIEITDEEFKEANSRYQSLSDLVLMSLPDSLLHPLLSRLRIDVSNEEELDAKQWLMSADPALRSVVSKEALQWKKSSSTVQEEMLMRQKAKMHMEKLIHELCNTLKKVQVFEEKWPSLLAEIVRNALIDYSQMDLYMKQKMQELQRSIRD